MHLILQCSNVATNCPDHDGSKNYDGYCDSYDYFADATTAVSSLSPAIAISSVHVFAPFFWRSSLNARASN